MINDVENVVLVGAGGVENAWAPVLRAVRQADPDDANFYFARIVSELRFFSKASSRDYYVPGIFEERLHQYLEVKKAIAAELFESQAKREIRVRPQFADYVEKFVPTNLVLGTTNWDSTLLEFALARWPDDIGRMAPYPIHGSIDSRLFQAEFAPHESLYLPFETTQETYRSDDVWEELTMAYSMFFAYLAHARRIMIYGLSLSPLDAEVGLLLEVAFRHESLEQLIVVNPSHDIVVRRLKVMQGFSQRETPIRLLLVNPISKEETSLEL